MRLFLIIVFIITALGCGSDSNTSINKGNNSTNNTNTKPKTGITLYTVEIVKEYSHDSNAFTQGLVVHNGFFYEGTGGFRGRGTFSSSRRKVWVETGKGLQKFDFAGQNFGEGITIFNGKIYQITWNEGTAFVYDLNDFKLLKEFKYSGEGWGLTHDGTHLIMTDKTHILRFVNPETFETVRSLAVFDAKGTPVVKLNELEYIKGEIWANVWEEGYILRIDPLTGKITGKIDLEKLAEEQMNNPNADVLNGIAYDEANDRIFITGKKWNKVFEIKLKPKE
ncbi:MAG TPA: glutaminyl-peptide cyclotransferase [Pyrinomonadaceae bacterium]|nr:glutaminyl-peptide cyclotransferase [Pyrinomonadaceae bacterium]